MRELKGAQGELLQNLTDIIHEGEKRIIADDQRDNKLYNKLLLIIH